VSWLTGNGDMHLKNFSLLAGPDNTYQLSPAYDLVCTRLVIPNDPLALPVAGKQDHLKRLHWVQYGQYCGLRPRVIERVLGELASSAGEAQGLVTQSLLSDDLIVSIPETAPAIRDFRGSCRVGLASALNTLSTLAHITISGGMRTR